MKEKRVLIVDDEAAIARLVALIVGEMGCQVDTASNGAEALQKVSQNKPDLIILDLIMPVMSGEEVIQEIQGNPELADIPIVLLSTRPSARGYRIDAFPVIPKPFETTQVRDTVRAVLGEGYGARMPDPLVLIVEDERSIATLLAKLVAECGVATALAHDGGEALRAMMQRRPDLILLDLIMPVMSGEEVLREMQDDARLADIPVIVITTKDMLPELSRPDLVLLQKPFAPAEVKAQVRKALHLKPSGA